MEEEKKFAEIEPEEIGGKLVFVATDETIDREGEQISIDGWELDDFKKNPVMLWSHDPYTPNIGSWENIRFRTVGGVKKLTMEPKFHRLGELSRLIADMVEQGFLRTLSVGFQALQKEGNRFTKQKLLETSFVNIPANPQATQLAYSKGYSREVVNKLFRCDDSLSEKSVVPFKETPPMPKAEEWEAATQIAAVADIKELKIISTWYDSEKPEIKTSYKLPHHQAGGDNEVVWRGVVAAMGALLGARGGVKIPDEDKKGVYNHLAKHYAQFNEEPPEFREYTEAELKELFSDLYPITREELTNIEAKIVDLGKAVEYAATHSAGPVSKGAGRPDKTSAKVRRLMQIANKALNESLRLQKQNK